LAHELLWANVQLYTGTIEDDVWAVYSDLEGTATIWKIAIVPVGKRSLSASD